MREIVLDTETTGLDPGAGHRVVEIACLELVNHLPTGEKFQRYLNPEREMPPDAQAVHGLTDEFLKAQPVFAAVVDEFLGFIGNDRLIIHNAEFDIGFINAELARLGFTALDRRRAIDTVQLARRKFPGSPASLDALCSRFNIDNSERTLHGALLDAELLSEVYLELIGGRQSAMELGAAGAAAQVPAANRPVRPSRPHAPSADESAAHAALLGRLKNPLWSA
ncbi:MAG: DNA polymerase III subunit epsilon [Rhodospirillales bacterium]|nr:DNA polymerase III subunit epsilon [Rhodospirillales bacterium]